MTTSQNDLTLETWNYNDPSECDEHAASGDGVIVVARRGTWVATATGHDTVLFDHDDEAAALFDYEETVDTLFGGDLSEYGVTAPEEIDYEPEIEGVTIRRTFDNILLSHHSDLSGFSVETWGSNVVLTAPLGEFGHVLPDEKGEVYLTPAEARALVDLLTEALAARAG